jgi:hypothetical protein
MLAPYGLQRLAPAPAADCQGEKAMDQIMRELVRHVTGGALGPEQLQGLIRAGYVYRNDEDHILTDNGRDALARSGVAIPPAPSRAALATARR